MDYYYSSAQMPQLSYENTSNVQSMYGIPDASISTDSELFRGLNSIGSHFDAFNPFSPTEQFAPQNDESRRQQQQQQQQQQHQAQLHTPQFPAQQPLQAPNSLSPESTHDDGQMQLDNGVGARMRHSPQGMSDVVDTQPQDRNRASSEEKDLAQDRRKAQNRAAQRAFRERKEKHVKELQTKLSALSESSQKLQMENERLRREVTTISTQNEILRATHVRPTPANAAGANFQQPPAPRAPSPTLAPQVFTPTDFIVRTESGEATWPLKFDVYPNQRGRMFLAGAAWDYIQKDRRVQAGQVDLEEVCRRLKGQSVCDGRGPAFVESEIRRILDECAANGTGDDLL